jgi:2'-5' RNA ligase
LTTVKQLPFRPFTLDLQGLFSFPPQRDRGVLWIGLQDIPPALIDLQQRLEGEVQTLGFLAEAKPFAPHLTIGRFQAADAAPILETLPAWAKRHWTRLNCHDYVLMKRRSGAKEHGTLPLYEVLAQFPA